MVIRRNPKRKGTRPRIPIPFEDFTPMDEIVTIGRKRLFSSDIEKLERLSDEASLSLMAPRTPSNIYETREAQIAYLTAALKMGVIERSNNSGVYHAELNESSRKKVMQRIAFLNQKIRAERASRNNPYSKRNVAIRERITQQLKKEGYPRNKRM